MRVGIIAALATAIAVAFAPASNAQLRPPGSIDLTKPVLTESGKVLKDDTQRQDGLVVLVPFEADGKSYKFGDKITDPETMRDVAAVLDSRKATFSIGPIDPTCDRCGPVTIGKILSIALASRICPDSPQQNKPPQCTADEERDEHDPIVMAGRLDEARRFLSEPTVVLGPKSVGQLKDLIAARFASAPSIVVQATEAIDPTFKAKEWGKD